PGHSMGRKDDRGTGRRLFEFIDEDGALGAQVGHDITVVHDLVAHIDGCAEQLERPLDDVDGAIDAGAETARLSQNDFGAFTDAGCTGAHHRTPSKETSTLRSMPASGWLKSNKARSSSYSLSTPE